MADDILRAPVGEATAELTRNLDDGLYADAAKREITVSQLLERQDPSDDQPEWLRGTDAFQRQMIALGIRSRSNPATGERASTVDEFMNAGEGRGAVLMPEYIQRTLRLAQAFGTNVARMRDPWGTYRSLYNGERFYASNQPVSDVLRPNVLESMIHAEPLRATILGQMVAVDEQVADARPYQGYHLTYDASKSRLHRITEGADPVVYELTGSDRTHDMQEFAFELRMSYRAAAEYQLPVFQQHLAFIQGQNDLDKEQVAYETIINGDGNSNAATNTNVSALTAGTTPTAVTYGDLMEWLRLFEGNGNYQPTIAIATSAVCYYVDVADFASANYPAFGPIGIAMLAGQGAQPERRTFPPLYARSYATANKLLAWDATKSLRLRYTAQLQETDRVISGRFDKVVISEFTGFDLLIDGGRRTLDIAN